MATTRETKEKKGIIIFNNNEEKTKFVFSIQKSIAKIKEYNVFAWKDGENIIIKEMISEWCSNKVFNGTELIEKEKKYYRIVFFCIKDNVYYFEKNGAINCIEPVLETSNYKNIIKETWDRLFDKDKTFNDNIIGYFNEPFIENYNTNIEILNSECVNLMQIQCIENFKFDYFDFLRLFDEIKEIDQNKKLPPYDTTECIDTNDKQSETVYNDFVAEQNNKYVLLDRKIINGCEVADLYDKENKLLFHNKKEGDTRVLSLQIIIGSLIMKNDEKRNQYIEYLKTKGITDTIDFNTFVIGIIGNKKKIAEKDKLSLGIVNYILKKHNIEVLIDFIDKI